MKYQVNVEDQTFNVEIVDLHERPIRVLVDGEIFEIWPEGQNHPLTKPVSKPISNPTPVKQTHPGPAQNSPVSTNGDPDQIKAPIPGVILSIAIRPGDTVEKGQELCVLEAMKMKNLIRSPRDGVITQIHVIPGQTVNHSALLMEYEPQNPGNH
jgi:glutaconyl-CoA/methylmalonyl-CoA decarboxylase subunit gamma